MAAPSPSTSIPAPGRRLRPLAVFLLACLGLFLLDALLFHTTLYSSILEPDSSTGLFEMILRREQLAQTTPANNLVVTLGNSRFAYSRKAIDQRPEKPAYVLRDAGIAGSDPRIWYYMLRDLDPTARRYRAIVLGLDSYEDEDRAYNPDDDARDLHYVIARLRFADVLQFARSFHDRELEWTALRGGFLKGIIYQTDIQAFLDDPLKRLEYVQLCRREYGNWTYDYLETERNMVGLKIDWSTLKVTFPPGVNDDQRATVNSFLAHAPDRQTGRLAAFRRAWLGRLLDRYRGSPTRIIFLRLPRGPIPRPEALMPKTTNSIREFSSRPNVILAPELAFESLERPEFFKDGMHLNREGIARFSLLLSAEVTRLLESNQAGTR